MMEREKNTYRNKKPHREKRMKQALPERRASESRYQKDPHRGSRDAHDDVTRNHPPSSAAAAAAAACGVD